VPLGDCLPDVVIDNESPGVIDYSGFSGFVCRKHALSPQKMGRLGDHAGNHAAIQI
jgi:hypothetical protein